MGQRFERSYRTAISRKSMSAPARYLKGADAYDPTFAPDPPTGLYDTILCTYVLNVVSEETEAKILDKVGALLKPGGMAYFTVRRDLLEESNSQRYVLLDLPILRETATHCIYLLEG